MGVDIAGSARRDRAVLGLPVTAEKLAINAAMAGCLPIHFPVAVTAWRAMLKQAFLLHGVTSSTSGCAILTIINGACPS